MSTTILAETVDARTLPTKHLAVSTTTAVDDGTERQLLFPNGGWDVHHHIFEPLRFEYDAHRHLTPPAATIRQFLDFKERLGLTHSVLTHGLSYGDDCTSLTSFVPELDSRRTSAIGVIDPRTVTMAELAAMHDAGIRGIRINLYKYAAMHDVSLQKVALREHAAVLKQYCPGWSMAFTHMHPELWGELAPLIQEIAASGVPVVTDHFALLRAGSMLPGESKADVTSQPGFQDILALLRAGALYIKISAPYRVSDMAPYYPDVQPLVRALIDANPRRVLWGSDWPHTPRMKVRSHEEALTETPFLEFDDEAWLWSLKGWLSADEWDAVMVRNPSALYGRT